MPGLINDVENQSYNNEDCLAISKDITNVDNRTDSDFIDRDNRFTNQTDLDLAEGSSCTEPMECGSSAAITGSPTHVTKTSLSDPDVIMSESTPNWLGSMQMENSDNAVQFTSLSGEMHIDIEKSELTVDDLILLCDLFYLPFEHGIQGLLILQEFNWLKTNAHLVIISGRHNSDKVIKPEVQEWFRRSIKFSTFCNSVTKLSVRLGNCQNRELLHDLYSYIWDMRNVVSLLNSFVKWLSLGKFPANINSYTQGSYTWFSKGWKETFMSGEQEPWVFRGGLTADLQRLIPVDAANDLFLYKVPEVPECALYSIRPYNNCDEAQVYAICHQTCRDGSDCTELFPGHLQGIPADRLVGPFLTITPEFCMVVENGPTIVGYACAALDARTFYRNQQMSWVPEMCKKYPASLLEDDQAVTIAAKESLNHFHNFKYECPDNVHSQHPSILNCSILATVADTSVSKRLITCLLAALRSNGSFGVHVCINSTDHYMNQFYSKLGFVEIHQDHVNLRVYLGRTF